jgi:hypothetical protein
MNGDLGLYLSKKMTWAAVFKCFEGEEESEFCVAGH